MTQALIHLVDDDEAVRRSLALLVGSLGLRTAEWPDPASFLAGFTSIGDPGTYSLTSTSILRDKGSPSSYPSQDLAGTSRYEGAAPDLGAYEGP